MSARTDATVLKLDTTSDCKVSGRPVRVTSGGHMMGSCNAFFTGISCALFWRRASNTHRAEYAPLPRLMGIEQVI